MKRLIINSESETLKTGVWLYEERLGDHIFDYILSFRRDGMEVLALRFRDGREAALDRYDVARQTLVVASGGYDGEVPYLQTIR